MSATLAVEMALVRQLLNDDNPARYMVDSPRLARLIISKAQEWPHVDAAWVASAFTLTANSIADYQLPTSFQYYKVLRMRIAATGQEIYPASLEEIQRMRAGIVTGSAGAGDPTRFADWEDSSQAVNVRFNLVPSTARAIDVFRSVIPASTYTDATVIPFGDDALRGIEKEVAAMIANMVPAAWLAERGIEKSVIADFRGDAARLRDEHAKRQGRIMQAPVQAQALSF